MKEAALFLSVSDETVRRLADSGKLTAVAVSACGTEQRKHVRITKESIRRMVAEAAVRVDGANR